MAVRRLGLMPGGRLRYYHQWRRTTRRVRCFQCNEFFTFVLDQSRVFSEAMLAGN
jgi:hypothetical protein